MAGVIAWHELFTDDVDTATGFYTELLGAEIESADMGDFTYQMLKKDGRTHGGFVAKPPETPAGTPNHWYAYVQVDDVDAAIERATAGGAEKYMGPMDVAESLRIGVLGDPQRATFGVMSWDQEAPTGLFVWDELHAADPAAAARFYGEVVGWGTQQFMENYEVFTVGEQQVAGLFRKQDDSPVDHWLTYLAVDDVDASTEKAKGLGANVMMGPEDIEGVGRFSVIADPTGAAVGLFRPAER